VIDVARLALLLYGVLMIVGGILGYVLPEKPSKISLISGAATGILAIGAYFISGHELLPGLAMGLAIAAGIGIMMLPRLLQTRKFMPMGMLVLLSAVVVVLIAIALATLD